MDKATNPGISLAGLYQQLSAATDDLGQQGRDAVYGSGRLNIARVSQMSAQRVRAPQPQYNNQYNNQYNGQYAGQAQPQYPGQYAPQSPAAYPQQGSAYPQQAAYNAYNNNQRR